MGLLMPWRENFARMDIEELNFWAVEPYIFHFPG